jgi:queuosine precursor transporter
MSDNSTIDLLRPKAGGRMSQFLIYLGTIVAANWAITRYGAVPVGFGLAAPAGVYFAGLAFTLRDLLHDTAGRWAVLAAIAGGAVVSLGIATLRLAVASAAAFTLSELADLAVYEPLHRHRWLTAVAASNIVGLVVDSALFLWLAFGSLTYLPGQVVGKAWMTVLAMALLATGRRMWHRRRAAA